MLIRKQDNYNSLKKTLILLKHNLAETRHGTREAKDDQIFPPLATIISNLYYYGYGISREIYSDLGSMTKDELSTFWEKMEPALREITLDNRDIVDHVVYQNFPEEVLNMSEAEYWFKQIFMYFGFDKDYFREPKLERSSLLYDSARFILQKANERSLSEIANNLLIKSAAWTPGERDDVVFLIQNDYINSLDSVPFKENLVSAGLEMMRCEKHFVLSTLTDVLRFIVGLSEGDITLKTNSKIKSFPRWQRKYILSLIDSVNDLEEGVMRHKNKWIRVFHSLHVGEYKKKYPRVYAVADTIRQNKKFATFNSRVEKMIRDKDPKILDLLETRPGIFSRRLMQLMELFPQKAANYFTNILDELPTIKLLQLKKFLELYPQRKYRLIHPGGNWKRMQIIDKDFKKDISPKDLDLVVQAIRKTVHSRANFNDIHLDYRTSMIKLPSNTKDAVLDYGRGTQFPIPNKIKFIRTATYWEVPNQRTIWYDNGWNFFDSQWKAKGTICWNTTHEMGDAAVFSGDPVSGTNVGGQAAQLIDLYLDKLIKQKIRFAVWNILCYSRISFNAVEEVLGLLEMGTDPMKGKLVEPSRATFAFPVKGNDLTRYVCVLDLQKRLLIYLDAPLRGKVSSAKSNEKILEEQMPAIMEFLDCLPSVFDIFESSVSNPEATFKILYDDKDTKVEGGYVFQPVNKDNSFENLHINDLLADKKLVTIDKKEGN